MIRFAILVDPLFATFKQRSVIIYLLTFLLAASSELQACPILRSCCENDWTKTSMNSGLDLSKKGERHNPPTECCERQCRI